MRNNIGPNTEPCGTPLKPQSSLTFHLVYTLSEPCPVTTPISSPISSLEYHEISISIQVFYVEPCQMLLRSPKILRQHCHRINTSCNSVKKFQ